MVGRVAGGQMTRGGQKHLIDLVRTWKTACNSLRTDVGGCRGMVADGGVYLDQRERKRRSIMHDGVIVCAL